MKALYPDELKVGESFGSEANQRGIRSDVNDIQTHLNEDILDYCVVGRSEKVGGDLGFGSRKARAEHGGGQDDGSEEGRGEHGE